MKAQVTMSLAELRRRLPPGLVARQSGNFVQIYGLSAPAFVATPARRAHADAVTRAAEAWKAADPAWRLAWNDFVRRHDRLFRSPRRTQGPSGYDVFSQASVRRQMLGFDAALPAPGRLPPEPLADLVLDPAPAADPRRFRFRITHWLTPGPDHVVFVRVTPATRGPARKPRPEDARYIAGWSEASTRELPPTGSKVDFENAQIAVPPGKRFGVYVRVVRVADGFASRELARDFIRL